jgi:hypothetical protein
MGYVLLVVNATLSSKHSTAYKGYADTHLHDIVPLT